MAVSSRGRSAELVQVPSKFKDKETSTPDTAKLWVEPKTKNGAERKVPVVYYLCRNGQLEHPHFMEVPLSSSDGLYLRDVIDRLNILRGKGMASLYSWSSKRSYKNGFVWHDLAENDFIYPAHGHEYVLKGSELLDSSINPSKPLLLETTPSTRSLKPPEIHKSSSSEESDFPVITRRRNQSWSSIDPKEYKVYKTEPFSQSSRKLAADASTQTDDKRRRRRPVKQAEEIEELQADKTAQPEVNSEEIEISPPPSDSSPETLETLMKADGRLRLGNGKVIEGNVNPTVENCGKLKASTVLMQLISCGSVSFRDCGATAVKDQSLSLIAHYKARVPRGVGGGGTSKEFSNFPRVGLEEKEYFSGSLIETKKEEVPALKRSNSYNADRSSQLQLGEKEVEGAPTKCMPRKSKATPSKKENSIILSGEGSMGDTQVGSKRMEVHQVENEPK